MNLSRARRRFFRQPGLTFAAITAFAMGIGFTTTMFGIVHGGTRSLPFDQPQEIVLVVETERGAATPVLPFTLRHWQASLKGFEGLGAWREDSMNVSGAGVPDRLSAAAITPGTLALLGAVPVIGRPLTDADAAPGAPPVALLSEIVWRARFGSDPAAVGKDIRLDGVPHAIVGVMPPRFGFPLNARVWTPLRIDPRAAPGEGEPLQVFGRLADGVTADRAEREVALEMSRLAAEYPAAFAQHGGRVLDFIELETPREIRRGLNVLIAAVSLAFLVACANVANLLIARAAARTQETALRTALGASRARIVRETILEMLVFSGISCAIGLAMASVGLRIFAAASAGILDSFWVDFRIDASVGAFAALLALLAALAAGLVPALRATAPGTSGLLQAQARSIVGPSIGRLGRVLVVAQIALACGLFILTATFVRASRSVRAVDLVFPAREILTTTLGVPQATLEDKTRRERLLADLKARLDSIPGLGRTAFVSVLPGRGAGNPIVELVHGPDLGAQRTAGVAVVTAEFFELAGARAGRGRLLTWQDADPSVPVAVVNHSFVRKFSQDAEIVGRRIRTANREFTVVGVVGDLLIQDVQDRDGAGVYLSMLQERPYVVRTMTGPRPDPLGAFPALRAAVHDVDPDLPVLEPASLFEAIYADKRVLDAMSALFLAFGLGTVFLAIIGFFAVLSLTVTARTREFGVRMALGATRADLVSLVLSRGSRELLWGLGLGLPVAFAVSRALAATLENVPAAGAEVFVAIVAAISAGALLAIWTPVRRVLRLSPLEALREE